MADFIDFAGLTRPSSPNTCLVAPDGLCRNAATDWTAPVFSLAPAELARAVRGVISSQGSWKNLAVSDDGLGFHFVAVTALLRFKDDIHIRVLPSNGNGSTIAIYSASRIGHSDLGANKKRVQNVLAMLEEEAIVA